MVLSPVAARSRREVAHGQKVNALINEIELFMQNRVPPLYVTTFKAYNATVIADVLLALRKQGWIATYIDKYDMIEIIESNEPTEPATKSNYATLPTSGAIEGDIVVNLNPRPEPKVVVAHYNV